MEKVRDKGDHLYADDTQLYGSFPSADVEQVNNTISKGLVAVLNFSNDHNLSLNVNKTLFVLFSKLSNNISRSIIVNVNKT